MNLSPHDRKVLAVVPVEGVTALELQELLRCGSVGVARGSVKGLVRAGLVETTYEGAFARYRRTPAGESALIERSRL